MQPELEQVLERRDVSPAAKLVFLIVLNNPHDPLGRQAVASRLGINVGTVSASTRRLSELGLISHRRHATSVAVELGEAS